MGDYPDYPSTPLMLAVTSLLLLILATFSGLFVAYDWAMAFEKFLALSLGMVAALCIVLVGRFGTRFVMLFALAFVAVTLVGNLSMMRAQPLTMASVAALIIEPLIISLPLFFGLVVTTLNGASYATTYESSGNSYQSITFYGGGYQSSGYQISHYENAPLTSNIGVVESIGVALLFMVATFLVGIGDVSSGLALLAGVLVAGWLVVQSRLSYANRRWAFIINRVLMGLTFVAVALYIWVIVSPTTSPIANATVSAWLPSGLALRLHRYHEFLDLATDYAFTGSGLAGAEMVYSTYLFMVQVPFQAQAHNLFLQLAVEQGIPALIGFVGLLVATLWALHQILVATSPQHDRRHDPEQARNHYLAAATTGSVVAFIINGMFDADIYSTSLVALILIPSATAWGLWVAHRRTVRGGAHRLPTIAAAGGVILSGFAPLLLMVAIFFSLGGVSAAYANAGAVAQTQAELGIYSAQGWQLQDQVRRTHPEQLYQAERSFNAAIALNPYHVTAHWRLAQIELAQGDYAAAEQHLVQAYTLAPHHRVVRQLLGELYATQGKTAQALALWQPLDVGQNQLQLRQWWYEMIGDSTRALNFQETLRTYDQNRCCP